MEWDNLMNPAFYALCVQQDAQLFTTGKFRPTLGPNVA